MQVIFPLQFIFYLFKKILTSLMFPGFMGLGVFHYTHGDQGGSDSLLPLQRFLNWIYTAAAFFLLSQSLFSL